MTTLINKKDYSQNSQFINHLNNENLPQTRSGKKYIWQDRNVATVLDVDFHSSWNGNENFIKFVYPTPAYYQNTKRGGFHLFYFQDSFHSAYEKACFALLSAYRVMNPTGVELLQHFTRYGDLKTISEGKELEKSTMFDHFIISDNDIALHREGRFEQYVQRLGKKDCPSKLHGIGPDDNPSVVVSESGIYCFRCEKRWTWAQLIHGDSISTLEIAARCKWPFEWTNLEFKRISNILGLPKINENVLRIVYKVMLNTLWPGDPFIMNCFDRTNFFRTTSNFWVDSDGVLYEKDHAKLATKRLPVLYDEIYNGENLAPKAKCFNQDRAIEYYRTGNDLPNVPKINIFQGFDILSKRAHLYKSGYTKFVHSRSLIPTNMTLTEAFDRLEKRLGDTIPRTNFMIIALAAAYAQHCQGERPLLVATGVSGGGKTSLPTIVSEILQLNCSIMSMTEKRSQFLEAFGEALKSAIVVIDESLKFTDPEFFLQVNLEAFPYRKLYVGNIEVQNKSVSILTGISFPRIFQTHYQFMRRAVILPRLTARKNWNLGKIRNKDDNELQEISAVFVREIAQNLPFQIDDYAAFPEYWKAFKEQFPEDCREETEFEIASDDETLKALVQVVREECNRSKKSKYRKAFMIPLYDANSRSWQLWQDLFPHFDYSYGIPRSINDFFEEQDWSEKLEIPLVQLKAEASGKTIFLTIKSKGRHL